MSLQKNNMEELHEIETRCLQKLDEVQRYLPQYQEYLQNLKVERAAIETTLQQIKSGPKRGSCIKKAKALDQQIAAYAGLLEKYSKPDVKTNLQLDLVPLIKQSQDKNNYDHVRKHLKAICDKLDYPIPHMPATMQSFGVTAPVGKKRPKKIPREMRPKRLVTEMNSMGDKVTTQVGEATYLRVNHCKEYLRQIQGKSRVHIPSHVLDAVKHELKKRRRAPESASPRIVRLCLRAQKLQKYYEHVPTITQMLNNSYRPIDIPRERELQLIRMFCQTEAPFAKHKREVKPGRQNFFSYPYVCYKMCELLGWDEYLPAFNLLKSEELLILQDKWWKLVCDELGWEFIPTIGNIAQTDLLNLVDGLQTNNTK